MDRLPPTIVDNDLFALLSRVLETEASSTSAQELRLHFFQTDFSWQALVDLATAHDLLPPLIFSLKRRLLLPPLPAALTGTMREAHVTTRLDEAYGRHLKRQEDLRNQLVVVLRALNDEGVVPVLLKGASHLTRNDAAWHVARSMRDIDILVRHFDAEKSNQVLLSLNYQADHDPPPLDRHLPELRLPGRAGTVEIHTEALSFAARHALSTEEVWTHARSGNFSGANFFVLPAEWHLLHGMLHHQLSDRGHARRMLALKGLWEFANVASDVSSTGWGTIIAHSEQRRVFPLLSSWAIQAQRLFGLSVPDALMTSRLGARHAEVTFARARRSQSLRQLLFLADKFRFAFAPATLAQRYKDGAPAASALRHVAFLWRRRRPMVRRWLDR